MPDAITNDKHKLMIKLMYSAGLRVSELLNLKIEDLDFNSFSGGVRKGKCNKDRLFILAKTLIPELKIHVKGREGLVLKGRNGKYSIRSVQEIIRKATKKAGIKKNVHPHTLRHSFATHLIKSGYAVHSVQTLLGHNSPDITMVYVHCASPCMINVESPLNKLHF